MARRYVRRGSHSADGQDRDTGIWRATARWGVGVAGGVAVLGLFLWTMVDRYNTGNDRNLIATLNVGLYIERLFVVTCVIGLMAACYLMIGRED